MLRCGARRPRIDLVVGALADALTQARQATALARLPAATRSQRAVNYQLYCKFTVNCSGCGKRDAQFPAFVEAGRPRVFTANIPWLAARRHRRLQGHLRQWRV